MDKIPTPFCPTLRSQTQRRYLLPAVNDVHTLQTDGHGHWFATTPMQEALGWLVDLPMEEGAPGEGTSVSCSLQLPGALPWASQLKLSGCLKGKQKPALDWPDTVEGGPGEQHCGHKESPNQERGQGKLPSGGLGPQVKGKVEPVGLPMAEVL